MKTVIVDKTGISDAAKCLKQGGLVVFPTETVYGLGADAFNEMAIDGIYNAKGRPNDNPLIVHIADIKALDDLVSEISNYAKILIDRFWPGPMTLIFKKNKNVIDRVTAGLDTVAVRFPSNEVARDLILKSGVYVAAPSANLSGSPSPTISDHVIDDLNGRVDYIIIGDECEIGVESTVIDVSKDYPIILRPGAVTIEMLQSLIPEAACNNNSDASEKDTPKCPGMKYTHYSPKAQVIVVCGDKKSRQNYIQNCLYGNINCGVLSYSDSIYKNANLVINAGNNMNEYAKSLFYNLRLFDKNGVQTVYAEFENEGGIGKAVENRLFKAAGYNVIYV